MAQMHHRSSRTPQLPGLLSGGAENPSFARYLCSPIIIVLEKPSTPCQKCVLAGLVLLSLFYRIPLWEAYCTNWNSLVGSIILLLQGSQPIINTSTHTVHMALVGYFIVFSFVTKPGQTLEFLLWGTIVPLNFLVGYYCSIVASTPQPMAYASTLFDTFSYREKIHIFTRDVWGCQW